MMTQNKAGKDGERSELYDSLDEHIKHSRKSDKSLFEEGKTHHFKSFNSTGHSAYGTEYGEKKKGAFSKFVEAMKFKKKKREDYEELDGQPEIVEEKIEVKMKDLDAEEQLIHQAEDEIVEKKRKSLWSYLSSAFNTNKTPEEKMEADEEFKEEQRELDEYERMLIEEEKQVVRQRSGLIQRIFNKFKSSNDSEPAIEEARTEQVQQTIIPELEDTKKDMKRVAQFSITLLNKLSPHQIERLKDNEDFKEYKDTLRKHGIIK